MNVHHISEQETQEIISLNETVKHTLNNLYYVINTTQSISEVINAVDKVGIAQKDLINAFYKAIV